MESIVKQFMAYVRQGEAELEVVNISDTVRHVIAANRVASQPDIQLLTSIEDGLEVRANPTDLARAVQNMIVNAGKYGRSSDGILRLSITLRYLKKRGAAELIVADDGKGLPESDLERVLRPFERGDTARGNADVYKRQLPDRSVRFDAQGTDGRPWFRLFPAWRSAADGTSAC